MSLYFGGTASAGRLLSEATGTNTPVCLGHLRENTPAFAILLSTITVPGRPLGHLDEKRTPLLIFRGRTCRSDANEGPSTQHSSLFDGYA